MVIIMNKLQMFSRFCLDIVYPNRCPCCYEFLPWNEYICSKCREKVLIDTSELCSKCGKRKEDCICGAALKYDEAVVMSYYENEAKNALISMKNSSNKNFGIFAGEILGNIIIKKPEWKSCDGIVPVPMNRWNKILRGYNQAKIIANAISDVTGIPVMDDCLIKRFGYKSQHSLNAADREKNTESFQPMGRDLEGMKLIICDDIITTGNTLNRCAELLKMCGVEKVYAAVAATVKRKREE